MQATQLLSRRKSSAPTEPWLDPGFELEAPEPIVLPERMRIRRLLVEAWRERHLLPRLGARFLVKFVHGTKLGRSWLVIRPLMEGLVMTLLFGAILGVGPEGTPYFLFLMSGLVAWRLFERTLRFGCRAFSLYKKMMTNFRFPLLLVPLASMSYPLMELVVYVLIFLGAVVFFSLLDGQLYLNASPGLLLVVPATVLMAAVSVGAALWVSVLNAKWRDTRFIARYLGTFWMYVTPVIYPVSLLEKKNLDLLATINPMSAPVEMMRMGLLGLGELPLDMLVGSVTFATLLLTSGLWYFAREAARSINWLSGEDLDEG